MSEKDWDRLGETVDDLYRRSLGVKRSIRWQPADMGPDDAPQPFMPDGSPANPSEYGTILIDARKRP